MAKFKYKVNLHIIENCNYRCKHCFAHFGSGKILGIDTWKCIIDNCIASGYIKDFNIAGGEPLLHNFIGSECSIITNGILMNEQWISKNAPKLKTIGFSIDSFKKETLINMGRCNSRGEYLRGERLSELCSMIKFYNPECIIKINTVVTKYNVDENIAEAIKEFKIPVSRWKVLKMDVFKDENFDNSSIQITDCEFDDFLSKNNLENVDRIVERDVNASYVIIDANGFLVDDSSNDSYVKIIDCKTEKFSEGFVHLPFNNERYFSRYKK